MSETVKKSGMSRGVRAAIGTFLMTLSGAMYAWSYFKLSLSEAYPDWTQTQLTLNFTLLMIFFCLGGIFAGNVLKRIGKPVQIVIAALFVAAGFGGTALLSANPSVALIQLYLCYGIMTGFGGGIAYNAVLSGIQPWFPDKSGFIAGALLMGMGLGALIIGNIAALLIGRIGLSATFGVFSAGMLISFLACARFIVPPPETGRTDVAVSSSEDDYSTAEMIRRPTFWIYFAWNALNASGGALVINSASSISLFYGLSAIIGLLVSVFNGTGRLAIGFALDRIGWKKTMILNNALLMLSGLLLFAGDKLFSGYIVLAGMLLMGVCYGGGITIGAAVIRKLYGSKHYASNFSMANLCTIPASVIGPVISAALQDASGGGYSSTFIMVIVLGLVTFAINGFIKKA